MSDPVLGSELGLDIAGALRQVDVVLEALQRATTGVVVTADARAVTVAIDAAVEAANAGVELIADADRVTLAIDQAVAAADGAVTVVAETDRVTPAIDQAVAAADSEVPVTADTEEIAPAIEEAVAGADPEPVEVGVDTGDSAEKLDEVAAAADETSKSVGNAGTSTAAFAGFADVAAGNASNLGTVFGDLDGQAAGAAAALTVLVGFTGAVFTQALEAEGATIRFNTALGTLAPTVERIDVGSLNADLSELAAQLGADDDAIRQSAASMFQLGVSSGGARDEVARTTEEVIALAARAVALNPALGDVGQVAEAMSTGLARGGRFAAQFGLDISSAEIEARALADTGKATAAELTVFERSAAGAQIAVEKYGDTLDEVITQGSANPILKLASLKTAFSEAIEEIGQPVIAPVMGLLEDLIPLGVSVATAFGDVARVVLPIAQAIVTVLGLIPDPLYSMAAGFFAAKFALTGLVTSLGASGIALGVLMPIITGVALAVGVLTAVLGNRGNAGKEFRAEVEDLTNALRDQQGVLRPTTSALAAYIETSSRFESHNQLDDLDRMNLSYEKLAELVADADNGQKRFIETMATSGEITEVHRTRQGGLVDEMGRQVKVGQEIVELNGREYVGNVGLIKSFNEVQKARSEAAAEEFRSLKLSDEFSKRQVNEAEANNRLKDGTVDYIAAVAELNDARDHASRLEFEQLSRLLDLDQAQQDVVISQNTAKDGSIAWAAVLGDLRGQIDTLKGDLGALVTSNTAVGNSIIAIATGYGGLPGNLTLLATSVRDAKLSEEEFAVAAQALGVSVDQLKTFVDTTNAAIDAFVSNATANLPSVADAITGLGDEITPQALIDKLAEQESAIRNFTVNVQTLLDAGLTNVAATVLEKGPLVGGALAQSVLDSTPDVQAALDGQIGSFNAANDELIDNAQNKWGPAFVTATGESAAAATEAFGEGYQLGDKALAAWNLAHGTVSTNGPRMAGESGRQGGRAADEFGDAFGFIVPKIQRTLGTAETEIHHTAGSISISGEGDAIGDGFIGSMIAAIRARLDEAEQAGREAANRTSRGTRGGFRAESPSRVAIDIGKDFAKGLAIGVLDPAAVLAAEQQARDVIAAATVTAPRLEPAVLGFRPRGGDGATAGPLIGQVVVQITPPPGTAAAEARELGAAAGEGFIEAVVERRAAVEARMS